MKHRLLTITTAMLVYGHALTVAGQTRSQAKPEKTGEAGTEQAEPKKRPARFGGLGSRIKASGEHLMDRATNSAGHTVEKGTKAGESKLDQVDAKVDKATTSPSKPAAEKPASAKK